MPLMPDAKLNVEYVLLRPLDYQVYHFIYTTVCLLSLNESCRFLVGRLNRLISFRILLLSIEKETALVVDLERLENVYLKKYLKYDP